MTRIIAGRSKGQRIEVPARGTRPTSDRVREACFSAIESWMIAQSREWQTSHFVDLFGGSGAMGLEAASRGAGTVTIVERNSAAAKVIKSNAQRLGFEISQVTGDVRTWAPRIPVNIIYIDPPYELDDSSVSDLLHKLTELPECAGALLIVERGVRSPNPFVNLSPGILNESWDRSYGDTRLWYGHVVGGSL